MGMRLVPILPQLHQSLHSRSGGNQPSLLCWKMQLMTSSAADSVSVSMSPHKLALLLTLFISASACSFRHHRAVTHAGRSCAEAGGWSRVSQSPAECLAACECTHSDMTCTRTASDKFVFAPRVSCVVLVSPLHQAGWWQIRQIGAFCDAESDCESQAATHIMGAALLSCWWMCDGQSDAPCSVGRVNNEPSSIVLHGGCLFEVLMDGACRRLTLSAVQEGRARARQRGESRRSFWCRSKA